MNYEQTYSELERRIDALVPEHPEVLDLKEAFDLFKVPGFKCDDLQPSLCQAMLALQRVQHRHRGMS